MGEERLFKLSIFSYCNSVISTFNLNVLFHSIMGLSTLNVVHLTYSTNASLLKNFKATGYLGFKVNSTYPGLQCIYIYIYLYIVCVYIYIYIYRYISN